MAFVNFETNEINCKVLYFGPQGAGKSETLKSILKNTAKDLKTGILETQKRDDVSGQFFNFLPISLGHVKGFHMKMHLFTMPESSLYQTLSSVILKGVDGFVYVADSRVEMMAENIDCLAAARRLLTDYGCNIGDLPRVLQYNKRDLRDIMPTPILRKELNPTNVTDQESIAIQGVGTMEALQHMAKQVIRKLSES